MPEAQSRGGPKVPCAIVGSGNIGTDLLLKLERSTRLEVVALVGVDPESDGLKEGLRRGVEVSTAGIEWVIQNAARVRLVYDATSAAVHAMHAPILRDLGVPVVDLTPAAIGPGVVPTVNLCECRGSMNVNMITCGGQATVPIVAAVRKVAPIPYAEIVSTVSSQSAGPGTRANIDEFTRTTARALEEVGGADRGKAIIVLNPAEPPLLMRNTVYCGISDGVDHDAVLNAVITRAAEVAEHVPGYRLKREPVIESGPFRTPGGTVPRRLVVLLEVEGAGDWFPPYAGNLDIMTASAVRVGEALVSPHLEDGTTS